MSNKEKSTTPSVRKVVVDIATHDDDGNPITDAMLSSGGARNRGPIVKQYTNPQPYEQAPAQSDEDRESDASTQRRADIRQRREEAAEERQRRENQEFFAALIRDVLDRAERIVREDVVPWASRKWGERKARNLALRESTAVDSAVVDSAADDECAVAVVESEADNAGSVTVENNDLTPVVRIEDYRRSA